MVADQVHLFKLLNPALTFDGLVWFLCLIAYQLFLGYLMPKPFS